MASVFQFFSVFCGPDVQAVGSVIPSPQLVPDVGTVDCHGLGTDPHLPCCTGNGPVADLAAQEFFFPWRQMWKRHERIFTWVEEYVNIYFESSLILLSIWRSVLQFRLEASMTKEGY
jgi:hypothetical protein